MHEVWQIVLEETDRVGKVRLQAADTYLLQISEPCKPVRTAKSHVAKKVTRFLHYDKLCCEKEVQIWISSTVVCLTVESLFFCFFFIFDVKPRIHIKVALLALRPFHGSVK